MNPAARTFEGELHDFLIFEGYSGLRVFGDTICGLKQFIFTVGVVIGLDRTTYQRRFCFDTLQNALGFYQAWDGLTDPVIGEDGCTAIK